MQPDLWKGYVQLLFIDIVTYITILCNQICGKGMYNYYLEYSPPI